MNVGNSVKKTIDEWAAGDLESAMLHACNAVDGTAGKIYTTLQNKARFTRFLRDNYFVLGPMGMPGINIVATRWPIIVRNPTAADGAPDLADVIYSVHRCTHGHGDELPNGFELQRNAGAQDEYTSMVIERGKAQLSDRILFGLIACAVLSSANVGQVIPESYYLRYGADVIMPIHEWWGRAADFPAIVAQGRELPNITIDFSSWGYPPHP